MDSYFEYPIPLRLGPFGFLPIRCEDSRAETINKNLPKSQRSNGKNLESLPSLKPPEMDGRNTIVSFGTGRFSGTFAVSFRECKQACWGMLLVSYLASLKIQNPKPVQTKSDKKLSQWFLTPYILTQFLAKSYLYPLLREDVNIIITPKSSRAQRKLQSSSNPL